MNLRRMAENLAAELIAAEEELLARPELQVVLGLPRRLRLVLDEARQNGPTPPAVRTLRFDFHYTTEGWRISEVNSDVPGGYSEASCFTELMADYFPHTRPAGDPGKQWTDAMVSVAGVHGQVALLSAPGFLEDQQVTAYLAGQLQSRGLETFLLHHPGQLNWTSGRARTISGGKQVAIDAIVRFYQGECLLNLRAGCGWKWLFAAGKTPVANPGTALITETKRFPLSWNWMSNSMSAWRTLLPECCDPTAVSWQGSDEWVLKEAFSNTGDAVHMRESTDRVKWMELCREAKRHPERWIVQRRFDPCSVPSDAEAVYPCIGVYTIDGRAAGIYARASTNSIIDHAALDIALLIDDDAAEPGEERC